MEEPATLEELNQRLFEGIGDLFKEQGLFWYNSLGEDPVDGYAGYEFTGYLKDGTEYTMTLECQLEVIDEVEGNEEDDEDGDDDE